MSVMDIGKPYFLTELGLDEIVARRPVVLFGAGYFGEKTLNLMKHPPQFFVDNNPAKQGTEFHGIEVRHPESLHEFLSVHPDTYVVVCVESYKELTEQLRGFELRYGQNCGLSPVEYDQSILEKLENHDQTILFSNYDNDGGLYLYNFKSRELQKVRHGSIRGFVQVGDFLYCCSKKGLHKLDPGTFEEKELFDLSIYNSCGITYDPADNNLIIGGTQTDEIIFVDVEEFSVVKRLKLSRKNDNFGREHHHVNDIVVLGDYILVSMFSLSGWWPRGVFDGGILEIDKKTWEMKPIRLNGVWMPHSLKLHNDHFYLLDSMNGLLIRDWKTAIGRFNSFMRGLEINGSYCYIGQSKQRHVSRLKDRLNTSIDTGIHIFDMENHICRFIQFDNFFNIYQIMVWDNA